MGTQTARKSKEYHGTAIDEPASCGFHHTRSLAQEETSDHDQIDPSHACLLRSSVPASVGTTASSAQPKRSIRHHQLLSQSSQEMFGIARTRAASTGPFGQESHFPKS